MTLRPCGFKVRRILTIEHRLPRAQKTGEGAWTSSSPRASRLKLLELAVATAISRVPFGGRTFQQPTNEHNATTGGPTDE